MKKIILSGVFLGMLLSCKNKETGAQDYINAEVDSELQESMQRGKAVYADLCVTCHLPGGQGIPGTYPPLDGSNWLSEKREESIRSVKFGLQGQIEVNGKTYNNLMPPMGLSDKEVADVMNYVMNSWSNEINPIVSEEEVASIEKN